MAARPTGPGRGNSDNLLLDHGDPYNSGQPPPTDDANLLRQHNISDSDVPRTSTSYDEFVGSNSTAGLPGGPGAPAAGAPYLSNIDRQYSQTSGLNNYQRYSDVDDFPEDEGMHYYGTGDVDDDTLPDMHGTGAREHAKNRNSILSLGGGLLGKAKNALGMHTGYSEMDLPLTETAARSQLGAGGADAVSYYTSPSPRDRTRSRMPSSA